MGTFYLLCLCSVNSLKIEISYQNLQKKKGGEASHMHHSLYPPLERGWRIKDNPGQAEDKPRKKGGASSWGEGGKGTEGGAGWD